MGGPLMTVVFVGSNGLHKATTAALKDSGRRLVNFAFIV